MQRNVNLRTGALRPVVELASRAVYAGNVVIEIVRRARVARLTGDLLSLVAGLAEIHVQESREELLTDDGFDRRTPTQYSRRGRFDRPAATTTSAEISGSKMGGTGCVSLGIRFLTQSNCVVFIAGIWTTVIFTLLLSWITSQRRESVKPLIACLHAQ